MKEVLKYWEGTFYTGGISFLFAVLALFVSTWKQKENQKLKPLTFFLLAYILGQLLILVEWCTELFPVKLKHRIFLYTDLTITIIEFLAFFYVIKNHIVGIKRKRYLNLLLPGFISWVVIYFIYYNTASHEIDNYFLQVVFTIQASFLIIACLIYYADLFTVEPKDSVKAYPSFWAITGITFFMLCTLPFSIFGLYLVKANRHLYDQLFTVFEVFYCILFLMIIRAYFCKPVAAK